MNTSAPVRIHPAMTTGVALLGPLFARGVLARLGPSTLTTQVVELLDADGKTRGTLQIRSSGAIGEPLFLEYLMKPDDAVQEHVYAAWHEFVTHTDSLLIFVDGLTAGSITS